MNKQDFLFQLGEALSGLPQGDIEEQLSFYSEMIDDKVENGLSEEAAVAEIGPADRIASQAIAGTPLPRLVRERIRTSQRLRAWEIVLLVLGFPLWFPLMMAGLAILLSGYIRRILRTVCSDFLSPVPVTVQVLIRYTSARDEKGTV